MVIHLAFLQLHSCCSVAGYQSTDARLWLQIWFPVTVIIWAQAIQRRDVQSASQNGLPCPVKDQKGRGSNGIFRSHQHWLALPPSPAAVLLPLNKADLGPRNVPWNELAAGLEM